MNYKIIMQPKSVRMLGERELTWKISGTVFAVSQCPRYWRANHRSQATFSTWSLEWLKAQTGDCSQDSC